MAHSPGKSKTESKAEGKAEERTEETKPADTTTMIAAIKAGVGAPGALASGVRYAMIGFFCGTGFPEFEHNTAFVNISSCISQRAEGHNITQHKYKGCRYYANTNGIFADGVDVPCDLFYKDVVAAVEANEKANYHEKIKLHLFAHSRGCVSAEMVVKKIQANPALRDKVDFVLELREPVPGAFPLSAMFKTYDGKIAAEVNDFSDCANVIALYAGLATQKMAPAGYTQQIPKMHDETKRSVELFPGGHNVLEDQDYGNLQNFLVYKIGIEKSLLHLLERGIPLDHAHVAQYCGLMNKMVAFITECSVEKRMLAEGIKKPAGMGDREVRQRWRQTMGDWIQPIDTKFWIESTSVTPVPTTIVDLKASILDSYDRLLAITEKARASGEAKEASRTLHFGAGTYRSSRRPPDEKLEAFDACHAGLKGRFSEKLAFEYDGNRIDLRYPAELLSVLTAGFIRAYSNSSSLPRFLIGVRFPAEITRELDAEHAAKITKMEEEAKAKLPPAELAKAEKESNLNKLRLAIIHTYSLPDRDNIEWVQNHLGIKEAKTIGDVNFIRGQLLRDVRLAQGEGLSAKDDFIEALEQQANKFPEKSPQDEAFVALIHVLNNPETATLTPEQIAIIKGVRDFEKIIKRYHHHLPIQLEAQFVPTASATVSAPATSAPQPGGSSSSR